MLDESDHRLRAHGRMVRRPDPPPTPPPPPPPPQRGHRGRHDHHAKALTSGYQPLSALLVGGPDRRDAGRQGRPEFYHGYNLFGPFRSPARWLFANLDIIEKEGMIERVREGDGPYLRKALSEALSCHGIVGEVRTFGFWLPSRSSRTRRAASAFRAMGSGPPSSADHAIAQRQS